MTADIEFYDLGVPQTDACTELLEGLKAPEKRISPKYFYDERGSELFTEITRQPEYYPTSTEMGLLRNLRETLGNRIDDGGVVIEYGSGSSEKIRLLLDALNPNMYIPLDISRDYLQIAAQSIKADHPWLDVRAVCTDFTGDFTLPFQVDGRKIGFFPGSSIGNFSRAAAKEFLARVRQQVADNGALLIGVDMKKDVDVLNRAYNDANGITEAFNLNVLQHLNREYGGTFDVDGFEHLSYYNEDVGAIQMFLVSKQKQVASLCGEDIAFEAGERIHTENSHKYSREEFEAMARDAGFAASECWQDERGWFSLFYLYNSN